MVRNWIFDQRGYLFVCGATKMGMAVRSSIERVLSLTCEMSELEASAYVKRMVDEGRYRNELFS